MTLFKCEPLLVLSSLTLRQSNLIAEQNSGQAALSSCNGIPMSHAGYNGCEIGDSVLNRSDANKDEVAHSSDTAFFLASIS